KEKGNALSIYQKLGFIPTGRRLDDEIELIFGLKE
ncbi:spermidine acetyltransferase, partial [Vibrio splendidus]